MRPFPVDDVTLGLLEHALGGAYDEDGRVAGADMNVSQLLDFLSGYAGSPDVGVAEYESVLYSRDDVIAALVAEVRRLRG